MHEVLLAEFGGAPGVRDLGALESSLMRPQTGYYDDLVDQAAALMESLANSHPFVDGNKRVAFFVTDSFLRLNGHFIDCGGEAAHDHFMHLFEIQCFLKAELAAWLRAHLGSL